MARQIEIQNETQYVTRDLRKLIVRCAAEELPDSKSLIRVKFVYRRRNSSTLGTAYYGGRSTTIYLERDPEKLDRYKLAHTVIHEMGHMKNVRHRAMRGSRRYTYASGWREFYEESFPWLRDLTFAVRKPKTRKRKGPEDKLEHARTMLATKQTNLKRAQAMVRRWQKKVRYYERAVAAKRSREVLP